MTQGLPGIRPLELSAVTQITLRVLAAIGVVIAVAGAFAAPQRMWASWLLVAYYMLGLGLAGLCFVAIHYTTGSTWSVAIRRVPEALAGTLPFAIALFAALFIVHPQLYEWTTQSFGAGSEGALAFKRFWLSRPFFLVRYRTPEPGFRESNFNKKPARTGTAARPAEF